MMAAGLVFIRKRTQKGRLKTNETFAKKRLSPSSRNPNTVFRLFPPLIVPDST